MAKQLKTWHRVKAPQPWRPKVNEELIGTYMLSKMRTGQFGDYRVHFVKSKNSIFYISGTMVNDLFALIPENAKVKLVFLGIKLSKEDREYKCFELYAEEAIEFKIVSEAT